MKVAITGGIAEGKSTVMAMIAALGHATVSSDALAREVFHDVEVQALLSEAAGLGGATVTPAELRAAITASDEVRQRVNRIMHPRVRARMDASGATFHEVPLLIEACLYGRYDQVWVVTCGPKEQRRRLAARLGDTEAVDALIASQIPTPVKVAFADEVLESDSGIEAVREKVARLVSALKSPFSAS
ncbi:MAG: dephospho-CoA kinase [Fimbriimonas sp.]